MLTPTITMNSSPPDCKKTHFPYPELDKIHRQPAIDQILKIYKQIKQNAASVPTTLAGGQHGFLSLVLTTEQWNNIQNVQPFERRENPGPFAPRAGRVTNAELAIDKSRWENCVQNYNNCQNLEGTPKNQLTAAFDYDILDGLRDRTTNTLKILYHKLSNIYLKNMVNSHQKNYCKKKILLKTTFMIRIYQFPPFSTKF